MLKTNRLHDATWLFLLAFGTRALLCVFPPTWGVLDTDEMNESLTAVDRWLGIPSLILSQPDGVLQFLAQPYIVIGFLLHLPNAHEAVPVAFAHYIAGIYNEPAGIITAMRLMNAAFSAVGVVCAYLIGGEIGLGRLASLVGAAFWLFSPLVVGYAEHANPDATAWGLAILSVYILIKWPQRILLAGFVFGCAAGAKLTVASLAVLLISLVVMRHEKSPSLGVRLFALLGGAALAFALFCPQIWIEPIRFAKAFLAVWLAYGIQPPEGLPFYNRIAPWVLVAATLILAVPHIVLPTPHRRIAAALMIGCGLMIVPLIVGTFKYTRYAVPLAIPLSILLALGFDEFISKGRAAIRAAGTACAVVVCAWLTWLTIQEQMLMRNPDGLRPLIAELETCVSTNKTILLPQDFYNYQFWRLPVSSSAWRRALARAADDVAGSPTAMTYFIQRGVPAAFADVFWVDFTEREQMFYARLRAMAAVDNPTGCATKFYYAAPADSLGTLAVQRSPLVDMSKDDAVKAFAADPADLILVTDTIPDYWHGPVSVFRRLLDTTPKWYVLQQKP